MKLDNLAFKSQLKTGLQSHYPTLADIYPNPAGNIISVCYPNAELPAKAIIYNVQGQEVMQFNLVENPQSFDISGLSGGLYILKISGNETILRKFIRN